MADGIQIDHAALDQHAQDIAQIAEQVDGAVNQVRTTFDVKAFGVIGTLWVEVLNAWIMSHTRSVDVAVQKCKDTADMIKLMNQNYQQNEDNVTGSFDSIAASMEQV
jgi:hypothetical protein